MFYLLIAAAVAAGVIIRARKPYSRISYPRDVFVKQERDRVHGLGWRTRNGQWMPYPGKPELVKYSDKDGHFKLDMEHLK